MEEYTVRAAISTSNKRNHVFKLHKDDNVKWTDAKMRRENDYQPWQIKFASTDNQSGRRGRRFKAIKEGGVGDNASFFVFYKPKDTNDKYEVCSIDDWYNVTATQRYKTLTAEEAELKFEQRHKMLNLFSVMHLKKNGENNEEGSSGQDSKAFKVSELDDWGHSGDDEAMGNDDDDDLDDNKKKLNRKKNNKKEKDDPDDAPDEAKEESDEGDFEQREVDYMSDSFSDSSDSQQDKNDNDVKGIAEEEALRELLSSDEDDDGETRSNVNLTSQNLNHERQNPDGSEESSDDSDDYDVDEEKMDSMFMKKGLPAQLMKIKQEQEPSASSKRKAAPELSTPPPQPTKRPCPTETPPNGPERIIEDLVKKYLSRKPMTLKALLKDIKSKLKRIEGIRTEMDNDLVNIIASIIKRLNPEKQKINNVTYLSLKS